MTTLARLAVALLTAIGVLVPAASTTSMTATAATPTYSSLKIVGNHFVTDGGKTVRLLGVQQQGLEYMCTSNNDYLFDSPHDQATIDVWKSWHVNTVRLPINESCWNGQAGVPAVRANYRQQIVDWVKLIRANGIFVIIDNHVATDSATPAIDILPMADQRAITMWSSVAATFRAIPGVMYDLYNEPNHISWACWRNGCRIPANTWINTHAYQAVGMQAMVHAVRSAGSKQPILVGGINWSNDNSQWLRYKPTDPANQLFVDQHVYGPSDNPAAAPCDTDCRAVLQSLATRFPIVSGEMGEIDCRHDYIDDFMNWSDANGIGYLGETWNATSPGGYECGSPVLLEDFNYPNPTPTPYGIGFRDHLQSIDTAPH